MSRFCLIAFGFLLVGMMSANAETMSTRFGILSVSEDNVLMLNGKAVKPEIEVNTSLEIIRVLQIGNADVAIIQNNGETACPAVYYAVIVRSDGARPTKPFGSCSDILKISQNGGTIIVEMPDLRIDFKQYVYRIVGGVVSESVVNEKPGPTITAGRGTATPVFTDPIALVTWLIQQSGHGTSFSDDAANVAVFSPGLRTALRTSYARSRQRNEPPCGMDGDIILNTQEGGAAQNLRLSTQATAPDRTTVASSFDVDGYHRNQQFMTVNLGGAWKLENIVDAHGVSLRRSLDCR